MGTPRVFSAFGPASRRDINDTVSRTKSDRRGHHSANSPTWLIPADAGLYMVDLTAGGDNTLVDRFLREKSSVYGVVTLVVG